jgi:TatD DNase family protein
MSDNKFVIAIGECGLDFDRNFSEPDIQIKWFKEQLNLANELKKPVFLHERSASKKFIEIIKDYPDLKKCVHCFTGNKEELETYVKMDCYIGITGIFIQFIQDLFVIKIEVES